MPTLKAATLANFATVVADIWPKGFQEAFVALVKESVKDDLARADTGELAAIDQRRQAHHRQCAQRVQAPQHQHGARGLRALAKGGEQQ